MPTIHVDEQVMIELRRRTNGRTPNDVIRGLLGLSIEEEPSQEPGFRLVPHGEFRDADHLRQFLNVELAKDGVYLVATKYYWRNVTPDSTCIFQKKKIIVGEGKMNGSVEDYSGAESSPDTGRRYTGVVHFIPASIEVYDNPISLTNAEKLLGHGLTFRGMQGLTRKDYEIIHKACSTKSALA